MFWYRNEILCQMGHNFIRYVGSEQRYEIRWYAITKIVESPSQYYKYEFEWDIYS